jgi:NADPH:quinone reductase-like Zn-dependent oxidoreductase
MTFVSAASIPHAAVLAYQGWVENGKLQSGMDVLINGGGGGVGMLGVQIANAMGAHVTGVDSISKREKMLDQGFSEFIDYQTEDFTKNGKRYDLILDARTGRYPWTLLNALKASGKYVSIGGSTPKLLTMLAYRPFIALFSKKKFQMVALKPNKDLAAIEKLYAEGKLNPVIDGPYPFQEMPKAIKRFGKAKHKGKVVVVIGDQGSTATELESIVLEA